MKISSPAFEQNEYIPAKFTCDAEDMSPPLIFEDVPNSAKSLVLIMDDPDTPGKTWLHWTLWNIDPGAKEILENSPVSGAVEGITDFGRTGYGGPCPPKGLHRYFFKLYALDSTLQLPYGASLQELTKAIDGHILDQAVLIGLYSRE